MHEDRKNECETLSVSAFGAFGGGTFVSAVSDADKSVAARVDPMRFARSAVFILSLLRRNASG